MTCEQVRGSAAGLASLSAEDEDRLAALEHARDCHECAKVLAEGERLLALIDALPPPPAPSPELLQRVAAEIRAELAQAAPAPRLAYWPRSPMAVVAVALVLLGFAYSILEWYHRPVPASRWIEAAIVAGLAAAGAAITVLRRTPWVPLAVLGVSVGFALLRGDSHPIVRAHDCTVLELIASGMAFVPIAAFVAIGRVRGGTVTLAGMSAAGALAGQAGLNVVCIGSARLQHLLVYHAGGVVVAALAAALLAQLPGLRARETSR
jgi:hypothetical protein